MVRASELIFVSLLALFSIFIMALPGVALTNSTGATGSFETPDVVTICDGNCHFNPILEERRLSAPFDSQFELGLKVLSDGLDLSLVTEGNIFIFGPLTALDTLHITATSMISDAY